MPALVCTTWNGERHFRIDHVCEDRWGRGREDVIGTPITLTEDETHLGIDVLVIAASEGKLAAQRASK